MERKITKEKVVTERKRSGEILLDIRSTIGSVIEREIHFIHVDEEWEKAR
jgi:hypothetical protein